MHTIISFGHKFGKVPNATKTFDVRFLAGPTKNLRKLNGTSAKLQKELFFDDDFSKYYEHIKLEIENFLTHSDSENTDMIFAIGCEEGIHRSVAIVERLKNDLSICDCEIEHRDLKKDKISSQLNRQKCRDNKYVSFDTD
jgi:UPF0042 nucleotide-binding protein